MIKTELIEKCSDYVKTIGPKLQGIYPISHDTRYYKGPSIFFAFPGARNNPLTLIIPLLSEGCPVVIYEMDVENDILVEEYAKKFTFNVGSQEEWFEELKMLSKMHKH